MTGRLNHIMAQEHIAQMREVADNERRAAALREDHRTSRLVGRVPAILRGRRTVPDRRALPATDAPRAEAHQEPAAAHEC